MSAISVVHLVRAANGIEPFRAFLDSYRRLPAGADHELVLLFKGFDGPASAGPYLELAEDAGSVYVRDEGFDLTAYRRAAEELQSGHYCFLNSNSVILAEGWLAHLQRATPGAGLVGASGSWGSLRSYARFMLGLGGPYAAVMEDRRQAVKTIESLPGQPGEPKGEPQRRIPVLTFARALAGQAHGFSPFPARHIRTNAFVLSHDVLMALRMPHTRDKNDAYRLESGRDSLTAQILQQGLSAVVVGRDGRAYEPADWPESRTFWQGAQENLLVADRQTARYDRGDETVRGVLSRYAWGTRAAPA